MMKKTLKMMMSGMTDQYIISYIYFYGEILNFLSMDSVKLSCKCFTNLLYIFVAFCFFINLCNTSFNL